MSFRLYLFVMSLASAGAWIGWFFVMSTTDPVRAGFLGFVLFYLTLFIALIGTLALTMAGLRTWRYPDTPSARHTIRSLRQAILLSILLIIVLVMQGMGLLRWWLLILSVVAVSLIELIFVLQNDRS